MPDLITNSIYHRSINGMELIRRRQAKGLSQAELAVKIGVSQGYICQIERPGVWEIKADIADKIKKALTK